MVMEIFFLGSFVVAAFGSAMALVLLLGATLHLERHRSTYLAPAIPALICLGLCVSTLLSKRDLSFAYSALAGEAELSGGAIRVLQVITLCTLAVCIARMVGSVLRHSRHAGLAMAPGTSLFVALMVYFIASSLVPCALGTEPIFVHSIFYPGLIFSAAWCARREPLEHIVSSAKIGLYVLMVGSLLSIVAWPSGAIQPDYKGLIPGVHFRLWGLGSNANSIGPLALLTFLLEVMQPTRQVWLRRALLLATAAVLVLAQSKTAWFSFFAVAGVLVWHGSRERIGPNGGLIFVVLLAAAMSTALLAVMVADVGVLWDRFIDSKEGDSITTLTGRTQIWRVAIDTWMDSPFFGYGPEIWGTKFRAAIGMPFATSAHNQFLQTLSMAGVLGLATLLVYLYFMVCAALRMAQATKGVSLALLAMVLFRCISETPLDVLGLLSSDVLTHFAMFVVFLRAGPPTGSSVASTRPHGNVVCAT